MTIRATIEGRDVPGSILTAVTLIGLGLLLVAAGLVGHYDERSWARRIVAVGAGAVLVGIAIFVWFIVGIR